MALYTKTTLTGNAWTTATNWTPTGYPGTNGAADEAQWTSATSVATNTTHSVVTVGKLTITNPTGTQSTSGGSVLTIDPTSFSGIGIELTSAGATAFTLGGATALGSSQEWTVASGRTLTVSGAVSGNAKNLTLSGAGTKTLSGASTGWTNSTVTVSAGQATVSNINGLGASSNNVVVSADANLTVSAAIAPTAISISGDGFTGGTGYGAFTSSNVLTSSQVITLGATGTVLSVNVGNAAFAAPIVGTVTTATLNIIGSSTTSFTGLSTYTTSGGVRLQSLATDGTTANTAAYFFGTALAVTDSNASGAANVGKGFGALTNAVIIEPTAKLTYTPPAAGPSIGTATLSRNYTFIASTNPTTTQANFAASNYGIYDWQGTVTLSGTPGQAVAINGFQSPNTLRNMHKFSGVLTGDASVSLWVGDKAFGGSASAVGTVGIGASLDSSGFQGTLVTNSIAYYAGTSNHVFPIVFRGSLNFPTNGANAVAILATAGSSSANHASYSREVGTATYFNLSTSLQTGDLTLGGGGYSSAPGTWDTGAGTLTLNFSFNGTTGTLTKSGVSTLVLGGSNTSITATAWTAGNLTLNSVNAIGDGADAFTATSTGTLDSTTGAVLAQTGANALNANFTWKGTASLTFGAGDVTASADRTVTYANTGETGTLKFAGAITTSLATTTWNFGGSTASAKQRVTLGGANASLAEGTATNQHAVTAGYFRIENNNGLGAVGALYTTTWWVGATNLGVQTTKAALELAGVTTPDTKSVNLYNIGPNDDGALIGVSGTSVFQGSISVPNLLLGARIGVKAGATLTLPGSGIYPNLNPANASTPLSFTAESGGTLNQDRVLGANVGTVAVTGGGGTVVFSRANLHTDAMTCSAGTTKLTHVNAAGAGAGNSVTVSAGATMESTVKAVFPATLTLGSSPSTPTVFKVSV